MRILLADDPMEELRRFLGQSQKGRGRRPADNKDRNAKITLDVESRVNLGMSIRAASQEVAAQTRRGQAPIDAAMVRKIHEINRDTPEVQMVLWVLKGGPRGHLLRRADIWFHPRPGRRPTEGACRRERPSRRPAIPNAQLRG
jgi:hypothetical protein